MLMPTQTSTFQCEAASLSYYRQEMPVIFCSLYSIEYVTLGNVSIV